MATTNESPPATIAPSSDPALVKKTSVVLTPPAAIFADPHSPLADQCFPGCATLSFAKVLGKLADQGGSPFQQRLNSGERVTGMDVQEMSATNGLSSRVFRCAIQMRPPTTTTAMNDGKEANSGPPPFPLILKVFSFERIDVLMGHFVGKENMEELKREMAKMRMENGQGGDGGGAEAGGGVGADGAPPMFHREFFQFMHRNECAFYDFVNSAQFSANSSSANGASPSPPLPLPRVYFTHVGQADQRVALETKCGEQGLIAMEDLVDSHLADFSAGMNREQVLNVVGHLAGLHAHLLSLPGEVEWQKLFATIDELFDFEKRGGGGGGGEGGNGGGGAVSDSGKQKWVDMMKAQVPEQFAGPLKRMGKLLLGMEYTKWANRKVQQEYGVPELLIHGDLWINNLLWRNEEPNAVAAFIDWQLAARGNPMVDIARVLVMSSEPEVRHDMESGQAVMRHYLDTLQARMRQAGNAQPLKFGLEELIHAYNLAFVAQSLQMVFATPLFQRAWAELPDIEERLAAVTRRAGQALHDVIGVLEREAPEWLMPEEAEEAKEETEEKGNV